MTLPVLLLGFNRPEYVFQRFQELILNGASRVHISIDGGYPSNVNWGHTIEQIRNTSPNNLELTITLHETNLGLAKHITNEIDKMLKDYESIVILEDDIRISKNFLRNMAVGLDLQRQIGKLGIVSGFSPILLRKSLHRFNRWRETPYFSCWGWACSRDSWKFYELDLSNINLEISLADSESWKRLGKWKQQLWLARFVKIQMYPMHTWDIQFQFLCFSKDFLNIAPVFSLSDNDGFSDNRSVHTKEPKPRWWIDGEPFDEILASKVSKIASYIFVSLLEPLTTSGDSILIKFRNRFRNVH